MSDLLWDDVRNFFDPELMGALPDLWVPGTSVEDWQTVFDLVRSSGWTWKFTEGGVARALPTAMEVLTRSADAELATLHVQPVPGLVVAFHPMPAADVDFDVDLRELQGQRGVDILCDFLCVIGRALAKPVYLAAEGDWGHPVLGFEPASDRVMLLANPRFSRP